MMMFLRCVGEAVVAQGMRGLMGLAPFGEQVYDIAASAVERYRAAKREKQLPADLQEVVQADQPSIRDAAREIARQVAAGRPEAEILHLEAYLSLVPGVARQSLRRPQDPTGMTVPATLNLADPIQLAGLLPRRPPRFKIGDPVPYSPQWRFVELLGSGGFGEVWLARHTFLDQFRAVKFCLDPAGRERLLRHEGEVVKRVMAESAGMKSDEHGIVPLVDAYLDGDTPWLAYEYIAGGDLAGLVRQSGQAAPVQRGAQALNVLQILANIVGRFHRLPQPIIHRDLKPANILLKQDARRWLLRITDFGISHVTADRNIRQATASMPSLNLRETHRGAHTPLYASPQQKRGLKADVRDDVHALGVIGYQLLRADLSAERPAGKWRKRIADCGLPDTILDLLESCWDDDPDERPRDALTLAEGLMRQKQVEARRAAEQDRPLQDLRDPGELERMLQQVRADAAECGQLMRGGQNSSVYTKQFWRERLAWWIAHAEEGMPEAQWLYADCLLEGVGMKKDLNAAARWFRKAADQGLALAQMSLGNRYWRGEGVAKNPDEAIKWYRKAAKQGQPTALAILQRIGE